MLIYLNGRKIETVSPPMLVAAYLYYFLCELFPMCVILVFYRVGPYTRQHTDKEVRPSPTLWCGTSGFDVPSPHISHTVCLRGQRRS